MRAAPHLPAMAESMPYHPPHGSCCKLWVPGSCCQLIAPTHTTRCRSDPLQVMVILVCDALQVWQAIGAGVLQLRAGDAGLESLGSIVGHSALQAALKQCVLDTDVTCIGSDARSISSLPPAAAAAAGHVLSAGDFSVTCSLLVGADGAASRVRAHSGIGQLLTCECLWCSHDTCRLILCAASAAINYSSRAVVATLQVASFSANELC